MARISNGTVAVTNGSAAITGTSTTFSSSNVFAGYLFIGPDLKFYEVLSITNDTSLTLTSNYLGTTLSGQSYQIWPLMSSANTLIYNQLTALIAALAAAIAVPSINVNSATVAGAALSALGTLVSFESSSGFELRLHRNGSSNTLWITFANATTNGGRYRIGNAASGTDLLIQASTDGIAWSTVFTITSAGLVTLAAPVTLNVNSASTALLVEQAGAGNVVQFGDAAGDTTPVVIDASGNMINGHTAALGTIPNVPSAANVTPAEQIIGASAAATQKLMAYFAANANGPSLSFAKSRNAVFGSHTAVNISDFIGVLDFLASDGTQWGSAARITVTAGATATAGSTRGKLSLGVTPSGAIVPTDRMVVINTGEVGFSVAAAAGVGANFGHDITGSTTAYEIRATGAIQTDVTSILAVIASSPTVVNTAFTLGTLNHFSAVPGTFNTLATVTAQTGFNTSSTMTDGVTSYSFRGQLADNSAAKTITSMARVSNVVTVTMASAHSFAVGQSITHAGNTGTGGTNFNVTATIVSVPSNTTYTFAQVLADDTTSVAGTAQNAAPGGGRYNIFMNGTAPNYVAGTMQFGSTTTYLTFDDPFSIGSNRTAQVQNYGTASATSMLATIRAAANNQGASVVIAKSRTAAPNSGTALSSADSIGKLSFMADDGVGFKNAAQVEALAESAHSAGNVPSYLRFLTSAVVTPAEAARITSAQKVLIGITAAVANSGVLQVKDGIGFPATQVALTDANTLDDYEEGAFTPAVTFSTVGDFAVTYTTQSGRYTKIGRQVFFSLRITTASFTFTTASGTFRVTGLPFTVSAGTGIVSASIMRGYTKANFTQVQARANNAQTYLTMLAGGSGQIPADLASGDVPTASTVDLYISGHFDV